MALIFSARSSTVVRTRGLGTLLGEVEAAERRFSTCRCSGMLPPIPPLPIPPPPMPPAPTPPPPFSGCCAKGARWPAGGLEKGAGRAIPIALARNCGCLRCLRQPSLHTHSQIVTPTYLPAGRKPRRFRGGSGVGCRPSCGRPCASHRAP